MKTIIRGLWRQPGVLFSVGTTVLAVLLMFVSPALTAPDEGAHLAYPRTILIEHRLPTLTHTSDGWENHQPPLYYLASLPIVWLAQGLPFHQQAIIDRSISVVMILLSCIFLWRIVGRLWPDSVWPRIGGVLVYTLPMAIYAGASYSNDILVLLMATLLLYLSIRWKSSLTLTRALGFGCLLGFGLLTKISLYPMLAVVSVWLLWRTSWRAWLATIIATVVTSGWWFVHNLTQVGDILGLKYGLVYWQDQHRSLASIKTLVALVSKLGASFIGVFGKLDVYYPIAVYGIMAGVILILVLCMIRTRRTIPHFWLLLTIAGITLTAVLYQNSRVFQPQGRYLIPLLPCLAVGVGGVIMNIQQPLWRRRAVTISFLGMLALNIGALLTIKHHYQRNPSTFFTYPASINVGHILYRDNQTRVRRGEFGLILQSPAKYVFSGELLETDRQPTLTIIPTSSQPFNLQVDWRVPGQTWFDSRRTQHVHVTGPTSITFPESRPTAIESIRLTFSGASPDIPLNSLILNAR